MAELDRDLFSGIFSPQPCELQGTPPYGRVRHVRSSQTPGVPSTLDTSTPVESPTAALGRPRTHQRDIVNRPKLGFLPLEKWNRDVRYDEDPPIYLQYSIQWSATSSASSSNGKEFVRDTEPDVVLSPEDYWKQRLQSRVNELVRKELGSNTAYQVGHTVLTVSVGRAARKLVKRFEENIEWQVIDNQLTQWADLFQSGKKLRVDITFHYILPNQQPVSALSQPGRKKSTLSATQRMRQRRLNQLHAQQESTGEADTYADVYRVMRCPNSCAKGPHCFVDPVSKRHYKMFTYHLEDLVERKLNGMTLNSQDDVPDDFRRQLFAEERQRGEPGQAKSAKSAVGMTPITINNHFPDCPPCSAPKSSTDGGHEQTSTQATGPLDIPSPLDLRVREYSTWQKSRVEDPKYKADVDKACTATLEDYRDLQQIYSEQDVTFLVEKGVRVGTAKRFINDIPVWAKRRRCND